MIEAAKEEIPSSFLAWCADPASAARMVNAEKPHRGIVPEKSALLLGQPVCNSTNALGLRGQAALDRVRSRCTGKERDTESGLDNFIKRYHASSLGRFMTPDPVGVMKQKLFDPQQWNMYSYVRNNPLRFTDPLGLWTCGGTGQQCRTIQEALANAQKAANALKEGSKERKALEKVLNFYGEAGNDNGVKVQFGDLQGKGLAQTQSSSFFGFFKTTTITFDLDAMKSHYNAVSDSPSEFKGEYAGVAAHEGQHGIDRQNGMKGGSLERYRALEWNAYDTQSYVFKGLGSYSNEGLWDPKLDPAQAESQRREFVNFNADNGAATDCANNGDCK